MTHRATKVSIVTERLIEREIEKIVSDAGAKGYTVFEGTGKGTHHDRLRHSMVGAFDLVKIEVIVADRATADAIVEAVSDSYFRDYSGIVYLEEVEVLRREKF